MQRHIVLLAEEPNLTEITAFRLEMMGYQVECVSSLAEALGAVERQRPGLLVVDLLLDKSSGLETAGRLASDSRCQGIPILGLSGHADLEDVQRAYRAGINDYLVTPYDPQVLEQKLCKLLPLTGK